MREKVRALIIAEFGLDQSVGDDQSLFASGMLDSLSAVVLLTKLNEDFGLTMSPLDVGLDDLDTVSSIVRTIETFG